MTINCDKDILNPGIAITTSDITTELCENGTKVEHCLLIPNIQLLNIDHIF